MDDSTIFLSDQELGQLDRQVAGLLNARLLPPLSAIVIGYARPDGLTMFTDRMGRGSLSTPSHWLIIEGERHSMLIMALSGQIDINLFIDPGPGYDAEAVGTVATYADTWGFMRGSPNPIDEWLNSRSNAEIHRQALRVDYLRQALKR